MKNIFNEIRYHLAKKGGDKALDSYLSHRFKDSKIGDWESSKLFWALNIQTPNVKSYLKSITGIDYNNYNIDQLLKNFTLSEENRKLPFEEIKDIVIKLCNGYIEKVETSDEDNAIQIFTKDGEIRAYKLSSAIDFDENLQKIFLSNNRNGQCHYASLWLAQTLNDPCELVTAQIGNSGNFYKYLHSWVETKQDDKTLCLDITRNLLMRKEYYYKLMGVDEQSLYRIPDEVIISDKGKFEQLYEKNPWFTKLYLSDREEAMEWHDRLCIDTTQPEKEV